VREGANQIDRLWRDDICSAQTANQAFLGAAWRTVFSLVLGLIFPSHYALAGDDKPRVSNCAIAPNEIGVGTEVSISFEYENVSGGLRNGKVLLIQKVQLPGDEKVVRRTSNWQAFLTDVSEYSGEKGRFEKRFVNPERWRGPRIELVYEIKVIDQQGRESKPCATKLTPK